MARLLGGELYCLPDYRKELQKLQDFFSSESIIITRCLQHLTNICLRTLQEITKTDRMPRLVDGEIHYTA